MPEQWYYNHEGSKVGPCTDRQLKDLAASGDIGPLDTIWKEGVERGALAKNVKNLFMGPAIAAAGGPAVFAPAVPTEQLLSAPASILEDLIEELPQTAKSSPEVAILAEETPEEAPAKAPEAAKRPASPPTPRKGRVVAIKGGTLVSQDGRTMQFKKKCGKCGIEDSSRNTALMRNGMTRIGFFCRKCKKPQQVEIQCIV